MSYGFRSTVLSLLFTAMFKNEEKEQNVAVLERKRGRDRHKDRHTDTQKKEKRQ